MGIDSLLTESTLFGFLYMLARISGVFAFLPLAAFRATPDAPKIVLSLALTLMLRPQWKSIPPGTMSIGGTVAGLAGEAALGIAIGVSLAIVFEVFQMAAQAVSLTAGFGYVSTIDPTSGADLARCGEKFRSLLACFGDAQRHGYLPPGHDQVTVPARRPSQS